MRCYNAAMSDNPYESPRSDLGPARAAEPTNDRWETLWSGFLWATIGLAAGTILASPFILSIDAREAIAGGMLFGGIPVALLGWRYGVRRANLP